ncbi:unnamed protein product, partial [Porites lobata]
MASTAVVNCSGLQVEDNCLFLRPVLFGYVIYDLLFSDSQTGLNSFLFQEKSNAEEKVAKTKDTTEPPSTTRAEVVDLSKEEKDHFAGDRYKEFLKEQRKREEDLAAKRKSATKKLNFPD